ncbi:TPA: hypothetical protein EYM26_05260 [Candidatus Poribacteria bacterium]|nr:hypothetical protein [Candidatus Poribacteria bacterium]
MRFTVFVLFMFMVISIGINLEVSSASWQAYNDCIYEKGVQFLKKNVTTFGLGRGNPFPEEGNLLQFKDGKDTGVMVSFVEHKSQGNTINWAKDGATFNDGSDAFKVFNDIVDAGGNMSYNDGPKWHLDLIISGLDPQALYTFVATVNRKGGVGYKERITNWKILEADGFEYACSVDAHKMGDGQVEFSTGENSEGLVAKWTDIGSGKDGKFIIRTGHGIGEKKGGIKGAHEYKGYAAGMFMLVYQGPRSVNLGRDRISIIWGRLKRDVRIH